MYEAVKFHRIYVELTNLCGLSCSFCPTKSLPSTHLPLSFFEEIISQASRYTREIACHVMGDPLTRSDLYDYLDIIHAYGLKAMLTTSGYYLKRHDTATLFHPCVKQINISLNAFNKNDTSLEFEHYMEPVLALCRQKEEEGAELFINLRVWNLDDVMSESSYNEKLFETLSVSFGVGLSLEEIYAKRPRTIRLAEKVLLHFDTYFEWLSLDNPVYGDGTCQGLQSHIGILSDGRVVPCCLDGEGMITMGNLHEESLETILNGKRATAMREGFKEGKAVEELCQKCSYKARFAL